MNWDLYVNFLIALLAIINPVSVLTMWSELTSDASNITAITRLFGIIVTAIAFQFILEGLGEIFPNWVNSSSPINESTSNTPNPETN